MAKKKSVSKPNINIDGNVKDSNIVLGDGNVITTIRKYVFRDTRQLAVFIISILLVAGGISGVYWYSKQPRKMTKNFNIAVAQFGEIAENGSISSSASAEKISSTLFNYLDSEYQVTGLGLAVQVAHKNMPLIIEDLEAKDLAKKVNADIVIYGNVFIQGDQAEFSPRFYVAEHPDTKELTGQNELAFPILFSVSELGTQDQINTELRDRAETLLNFTKALVFFSQNDLDAAFRAIQTSMIASDKASKPFAGQEVIYLLASQIQTSKEDFDKANEMLDQALVLNPQYARAHLARGNIFYLQSLAANFNAELLDKAQNEYTLAFQMPNQPEGAYIPIKAHTALGNVLVIKAQQTNNPALFSQAIEHYEYVTDQYEHTKDSFLRIYASIAYFGIGAANERQGQIEQAISMYNKSYSLTDDQEFKDRIQAQIKILQGE